MDIDPHIVIEEQARQIGSLATDLAIARSIIRQQQEMLDQIAAEPNIAGGGVKAS